jgi:adenosylhomocysteine nucleosidase
MRSIVEPRALILAPLAEERAMLLHVFGERRPIELIEPGEHLRIPCAYIAAWRALVAPGGHGKAQFAAQSQYVIDQFPSAELVICAGAAGSLHPDLTTGDVVVGTETVEHDFRLLFATRPLPRFPGHAPSLARLRTAAQGVSASRLPSTS